MQHSRLKDLFGSSSFSPITAPSCPLSSSFSINGSRRAHQVLSSTFSPPGKATGTAMVGGLSMRPGCGLSSLITLPNCLAQRLTHPDRFSPPPPLARRAPLYGLALDFVFRKKARVGACAGADAIWAGRAKRWC